MNSDLKTVGIWAVYISALVCVSAAVRQVHVQIAHRKPLPVRIVSPGNVTQPPAKSEPARGTAGAIEPVKQGENQRSPDHSPIAKTEQATAFHVSIAGSYAFREADARRREEITVVFQLDRAPSDHSISIRTLLGGTATGADYEVVDRPQTDFLRFEPGTREAKLVLRRLPGPRGCGNRVIEVACEPANSSGELDFGTGQHRVNISVADPPPTLSWTVGVAPGEPAGAGGRAAAKVCVTLAPPTSKPLVFRYRIVDPTRSAVAARERALELTPPADPWSKEQITAEEVIELPRDDLVVAAEPQAAASAIRLEPAGEFANHLEPLAIPVLDRATKRLSGHVLVILVHTNGAGGNDDVLWRELQKTLDQAEKEGLSDRLVDRSLFVLDASKNVYRLRLDSLTQLDRFPADAALEDILDASTKGVFQALLVRMSQEELRKAKAKKVLVLRDLGARPAAELVKSLNIVLPGDNWWVYCIDPQADASALNRGVAEIRKEVGLEDFAVLKDHLAERLLAVVRGGG